MLQASARAVTLLRARLYHARMPESPEDLFARAAGALRTPDLAEWVTWPFAGELHVKELLPPLDAERPRHGEGGVDCHTCTAPDEEFLWTSERWLVSAAKEPSGLPIVVFLHPRAHHADPGDLPDDLAAEFGIMTARLERAIRSIGDIGRVHIARWGDGGEHLHWWFYARPARMLQMYGTFAAVWDDVLPPTPPDIWRANLAHVAKELSKAEQ